MRIAVLVLVVVSSTAHADDECTGSDADTESCSALWPTHDGRAPASVTGGFVSDAFDPAGHTFDEKRIGYASQTGQFDGDRLAPMRGNGFYLDVRMHVTPMFYVGIDLRAAWANPPA